LKCFIKNTTTPVDVVIRDCLLDPTKQYLVVSTYSAFDTDCYIILYKIDYTTGNLTYVSQHDACCPSYNFQMAFDSSGSYLLGYFSTSTAGEWHVRPYFISYGTVYDGKYPVQNLGVLNSLIQGPAAGVFYGIASSKVYPVKLTVTEQETTKVTAGAAYTTYNLTSLCFNPAGTNFYGAGAFKGLNYGSISSTLASAGIAQNGYGRIESMVFVTTPESNTYVYAGAPYGNCYFGIFTIGVNSAPSPFRYSSNDTSNGQGVETSSAYGSLSAGVANSSFRCLSADPKGKFLFAVAQAQTKVNYPTYVASFTIGSTTGVVTEVNHLQLGLVNNVLKTIVAAP
jgi:hypothetical protein